MKVSSNWIREYLNFDLPPTEELVLRIGAQLGGVDDTLDLVARYQGIVIVRVVSVRKLEDSDHLNVCLIDDGTVTTGVNREADGLVQVVCGAPNVREGMLVAWLPPGSSVPSSFDDAEPFVLTARPLRGVVSNGMLASAKELAISDSHDGILELESDRQPGEDFATVYGFNDVIIDIENKMFTHRPDCFGQLGVAREVAGILNQPFISPEWFIASPPLEKPASQLQIEVSNEIPELVSRYMLAAIEGVSVEPSPVWLQTYLSRVGVRPINNIVDVTNYLMLLTGQPLHAFDLDKVARGDHARIVVRNPHTDETVTLLDGKTVKPRANAILICDDEKAIGLGGVMGGNNSEIDASTTRILIESASFDMFNIRRTSMEHGIFSDAVTRFTKGQSEWQCPAILQQAIDMVQKLCSGAQLAGEIVDEHQPRRQNQAIPVAPSFINSRLGLQLPAEDMQRLLQNVEFSVEIEDDVLNVTAPFWRTDIELREDVVEEVGRLYGFDHLPTVLPKRDISPAPKNEMFELKAALRSELSRSGANEALTYSFVHGNLFDKVGQHKELAFKLSNALSPDLQYYRLSLTPSLLDKVHLNIKAGFDQFALFELGKSHTLDHTDDPAHELTDASAGFDRLALVVAADAKAAKMHTGAAYYLARQYLMAVLDRVGITDRVLIEPYQPNSYIGSTRMKTTLYEVGRTASLRIDNYIIGEIGEYKATVRKALKLPDYCAGFELDLSVLLQYAQAVSPYVPLPRFPKIIQDITLKVARDVRYQQLYDAAWLAVRENMPDQTLANLSPVDIYQSEADMEHKHISLRLSIASYERTLTDAEVNRMLDVVADSTNQVLGAERI